jgi:ribosomal protein S26
VTRKRLGYVQLEWTCPNCGTRNPGPQKSCSNCGAPQPEDVAFERAADEKTVTDAAAIDAASAGADYICPYCGTRNGARAKVCVQCGGDLVEAKRRAAGGELQASADRTSVECPNCGTANPASSRVCSNCGAPLPRASQKRSSQVQQSSVRGPASTPRRRPWLVFGLIGGAVLLCGALLVALLLPSKSVAGRVTDIHWQTSVPVQEIQPAHYSEEAGSPPSGAYDVSCHTETRQVCTERVVDQGNGYGEKVQDCQDESQDYCSYTVDEWQTVQTYTLDGHDYNPVYSQPSLSSGQRLGDESTDLAVLFDTDGGQKTYKPSDVTEYSHFEVGSTWTLKLNAFGGIVSVGQ